MIKKFFIAVFIIILFLFFPSFSLAAAPTNGKIIEKNGQRVLQLSGTHYEMGYAQGYLIGSDIMLMIEKYLIEYLLNNNTSSWDTVFQRVQTKFQFGRFEDEINGIYEGMLDSGTDIYVDRLGRNLNTTDLKVWNAMYEAGLISPLCSSFAVWGSAAGDNGVLHGRNMDFPYDTRNGYAANKKLIIAYQPTGGQQYMVVTWPGFISPGTGMNQSNLALSVNVGPGPQDKTYSRNDYVLHGIVFREILEDVKGSNDLLSQVLSKITFHPRTRSTITQFTQPEGRGSDTSIVIEADANGAEVRHASASKPYVYATNHYIQRSGGSGSGNTVTRYQTLTTELNRLTTSGDSQVSLTEAQELLQDLAISWPTILSIYMYPETLSFSVSFARTSGQNPVSLTAAPFVTPVNYTWNELFSVQPSPSPVCPGNLNTDNVVNLGDLSIVLSFWGNTSAPVDLNNDHMVNLADLAYILAHWGQCP